MLAAVATVLALYAVFLYYRLSVLKRAIKGCRVAGPEWLRQAALRFGQCMAHLVGVRIASLGGEGLDADKSVRYMYAWHPHGFISYVPSYLMGDMATSGKPHDRVWFGTCAPILFKIPILGELFTLANARPVDKRTMETILGHRNGSTIAVQPGGIKEQAATRHDQEQAFFPRKLGFIRLAIRHQTPLMPLYLFGENQVFPFLLQCLLTCTDLDSPASPALHARRRLRVAHPRHLPGDGHDFPRLKGQIWAADGALPARRHRRSHPLRPTRRRRAAGEPSRTCDFRPLLHDC